MLTQFGLLQATSKPCKIHVLGNALSRARIVEEASLSDLADPFIKMNEIFLITTKINFLDQISGPSREIAKS